MLVHADGFGIYGTTVALMTGLYTTASGITLSAVNPRTGTWSVRAAASASGHIVKSLDTAAKEVGVTFAISLDTLPVADNALGLMALKDNLGGVQASAWVRPDGTVRFLAGDAGAAVLGTTAVPIVAGQYVHLEAWIVVDDTEGSIQFAMGTAGGSQVEVLNLTGINTSNTGVLSASSVRVVKQVGTTPAFYLADLVIYDDTGAINNAPYNGMTSVVTPTPAADASPVDWTKSTGANSFSLVNGIPPDDTKFISTNTLNATTVLALSDISTGYAAVKGVIVYSRQKQSSAGTATTQVQLERAGTVFGTSRSLTTSFAYYKDVFETNPNTTGVWTPAEFNLTNIHIVRKT